MSAAFIIILLFVIIIISLFVYFQLHCMCGINFDTACMKPDSIQERANNGSNGIHMIKDTTIEMRNVGTFARNVASFATAGYFVCCFQNQSSNNISTPIVMKKNIAFPGS